MDKLVEILDRIRPDADLPSRCDLVDSGMLDSIDIVMIITEIEKAYSVEIDPKEIEPENFQSVASMYEMIRRVKGED